MHESPFVRRLRLFFIAGALAGLSPLAALREGDATPTICVMLAASEWPLSRPERQRLLREMDSLSDRCVGSAAFLALLGALWLDEGEAGQALLWLERAILLDPSILAARVDHALALAALGQPAAKDELLAQLGSRSDVPLAVKRRLSEPVGRIPKNGPLPSPERDGRWLWRGELSLKHGHDTNLDRSPVLDGITLTSPDGPIDLPLAIPLRPRAGQASMVEGAFRVAHDTGRAALWQISGALAARRAPAEPQTDWQYLQVRGDHWRAWGPWRAQIQLGFGRSTGPLNEPYSVYRIGAALERDQGLCTSRASFETEARRQQTSRYLDGNLRGALGSVQCRMPWASGWRMGVEARASSDAPRNNERPGGSQVQTGATVRIAGRIEGFNVEASAAIVRAHDREGYSPLLQNNARRSFRQRQVQVEVSYPLTSTSLAPAELFLQWSSARQVSNIELFSDSGFSTYGGLRWRW